MDGKGLTYPLSIGQQPCVKRAVALAGLLTVLAAAGAGIFLNMRAVASGRQLASEDETRTWLTLLAHDELTRLRTVPWEELDRRAGVFTDPHHLGLKRSVEVGIASEWGLRRLVVRLEYDDRTGDPLQVDLSTWRESPMAIGWEGGEP